MNFPGSSTHPLHKLHVLSSQNSLHLRTHWWRMNCASQSFFFNSLYVALYTSVAFHGSGSSPFCIISHTFWYPKITFIWVHHLSKFLPSRMGRVAGKWPLFAAICAALQYDLSFNQNQALWCQICWKLIVLEWKKGNRIERCCILKMKKWRESKGRNFIHSMIYLYIQVISTSL